MNKHPQPFTRRQVAEWSFHSRKQYENPFVDISVDVLFTEPGGKTKRIPAFYNGENTWVVRFNPETAGAWHFQVLAIREDEDL